MAEMRLNGMRVAILSTDGFEQSELIDPRKALEQVGARCMVIAPKSGYIQGFQHDEKGEKVKVDIMLNQAKPGDFDAVLLPGGALNADALRVIPEAQKFVKAIDLEGKPIGVICHGPWLLVSAALVRGRRMTSYHTIADDLRNAGAEWQDRECVRDRNWVSSRQPSDLPAFNRELIALCTEVKQKQVA